MPSLRMHMEFLLNILFMTQLHDFSDTLRIFFSNNKGEQKGLCSWLEIFQSFPGSDLLSPLSNPGIKPPNSQRSKPRLPSCSCYKIMHTAHAHKNPQVQSWSICFTLFLWQWQSFEVIFYSNRVDFHFLQAVAGPHHYFLTMKAEENKIQTMTRLSLTFSFCLSFFFCQFWLLSKLTYTFNYPQQQRPHKWDQKLSKLWHCACQLENHLVSLSRSRLSDVTVCPICEGWQWALEGKRGTTMRRWCWCCSVYLSLSAN